MNSMQDKTLVCSDCGQEFTFQRERAGVFHPEGFQPTEPVPSVSGGPQGCTWWRQLIVRREQRRRL